MAITSGPEQPLSAYPFRPVRLATDRHDFDARPDGTSYIRCREPLARHAGRVTDWLVHFAAAAPHRTFVAKRDRAGSWQTLTYAEALRRAETLGGALLAQGLSADRPLVILSGNDLDHAALALAAMHAGIPYAPVSPAYSTIGGGFERLRDVLGLLTPGLVFAADGAVFGKAIAATLDRDVPVIVRTGSLPDREPIPLARFGEDGRGDIGAAHASVTPDTIAKFLFTSGSTGLPKAVITTHGMLCANAAQLQTSFPFLTDEPPRSGRGCASSRA